MNVMVLARACGVVVILAATVTSSLAAQSAGGDVQGAVVTGVSTPLAGVTVTITNAATHETRETITGADGVFIVAGLPAGVYEAQASHQGYATRRQSRIPLHPGQVITLRLELAAAPDPETIMLGDIAPMLERTRSHVSSLVDAKAVEQLPTRTRSALELANLAAGSATACDSFSNAPCAERNRVIVEGADRTGTVPGAEDVSQEALASIFVTAHSYPAEYGRAPGAFAGISTRSGSNKLAGSLFAYRGNTWLSSKTEVEEQLDLPKGDYSLNQFGGSIGGRLIEGHYAFGMYDGRRESALNQVVLGIPDAAAPDRLTRFAASWERPRDRDDVAVKTTHALSDTHRLMLQYRQQRNEGMETGPYAIRTARDAAGNVEVTARNLTAVASSMVGQSLFNEARIQIARDRETGTSNGSAPEATIRYRGSEALRIGSNSLAARESTVGRLQLADTLTLTRGAHKLKAGVDLLFDDVESMVAGNFVGSYVFNTPAAFERGVPSSAGDVFTQTFERAGTPGRLANLDVRDYAVFAQDEWRVGGDLTLNLGVRYDVETFPAAVGGLPEADSNNFEPRLGAAWAPAAVSFVVRGGYGLTHGRTPWPMAAAALAYNGANLQTVTLRPGEGDAALRWPARLTTAPRDAGAPLVVFDPGFESSSMHHASVGVDWEWMPNTELSVSYLFTRGSGLPRAVESGAAAQRRILLVNDGDSRYNGIAIELLRRFSQGHQYRVSYTLGRAEDTMPLAAAIAPGTDADRAIAPGGAETARRPADHDRRHRFVGTLIYDSNRFAEGYDGFRRTLLSDWTLSGVYTARSGLPFTAYAAADLNRDGNRFNDVAPGTARNQYRRVAHISADIRLAREIDLPRAKATVIWEAFNLLNRANGVTVDDTFYFGVGPGLETNPLFGQMLDQADPRRMRFAVRLTF